MRGRGWLLAVALVVVGACEFPRPADVKNQAVSIGGTVHGMWTGAEGVALRLSSSGADVQHAVTSNGSFTFPLTLAEGDAYEVALVSPPARHTCSITAGRRGDHFGADVALFGDVLAVGAYDESSAAVGVNGDQQSNDARQSGAVYVFRRSGSSWEQEAYVKASNTDSEDYFGSSIAASEDTLVVGALGERSSATGIGGNQEDNGALLAGAVYIFR